MSTIPLPKIQLRPYQTKLVDDARKAFKTNKRVLLQSATGSGKTRVFCDIAAKALAKGGFVRVVVHRVEILEQTLEKLEELGISPAIIGITPGWQNAPIAVGMVMTAKTDGLSKCGLVIVDEAHHAAKGSTWSSVLSAHPSAYVLGLTATPKRLDGKGLSDHFDTMVQGPTVRSLTDQGYLADIDAWADPFAIVSGLRTINRQTPREEIEAVIGGFVDNAIGQWKDKGRNEQTIAFLPSVRAGEFAAERFRQEGIPAESVDGNLGAGERKAIMGRYAAGDIKVLVNCQLIDEGVDVPETGCIILADCTESLTRHFQRIGRGMRPKSDQRSMVLLDLAGNIQGIGKRKGLGLPCDIVEWTLEGKAKTEEQVIREREKSEEAERQQEAIAQHSGTVERIVTSLDEARTFKQAARFITTPKDLLTVKKNCRRKDGKPYSDAFLIRYAAETFYPNRPWHQALIEAGKALSKRAYVDRTISLGLGWTHPPSTNMAA